MMAICGAAALFAAAMLLYILVVIFLKGVASLNPHFILFSEINTGLGLGTGVGNAIAGTILLAVISTILAIPLGVGTAIYLRKYASDNQLTRFLRLMIEVLSGTPSIVLGIFGVAVLVIYLKPITGGESLIAGAIALGVLIIPVIERSTEEALSRVPCELEEGSYALGATKWLTVRNIVIPYALSGIIVGAILGFGRAAEESAVVLLTAGYSQYMPQFRIAVNPNFLLGIKIYPLNDLVGSLPVFLYTSYENSNVFPVSSIFAAGFILIVIVLFINLSAKAILFYATAKT
ncbi:MAG: phosphate ABC transporter permease PstA, partial [Methanoregula sp.]